jgi:hypothetical protein
MRQKRIAVQALVVMGMALLGWLSPASADGDQCGAWVCVDLPLGCDEEEFVEEACFQLCPHWHVWWCYDIDPPCDEGEAWLKCSSSG